MRTGAKLNEDMKTKIELKKEIYTDGKLWYSVYLCNRYVGGSYDLAEAERLFDNCKQLINQGETISPQTIKEEQI